MVCTLTRRFRRDECFILSSGIPCYSNFVSSTLDVFRETGAYLKGHFRLTSGLHSNEYLQCALVLQHPARAERLGHALAALLPACDMVVSPAVGGLIIGHEVARAKGSTGK